MELASGSILARPLEGSDLIENATPYMWPTYKRTSRAMGGDWAASFTVGAGDDPVDDYILETWYSNYLGCKFEERFGGERTFVGLITGMRLSYRGDVHSISLDDMANNVACWYTPGPGQPRRLTSFFSDATSIAKYGTKTLLINSKGHLSQSAAEQRAEAKLAQLANPRSVAGDMGPFDGKRGQLQINIIGLARTMDWTLYNSTSTAFDDADDQIATILAGVDFVSAGTLETNTTQVPIGAEYRPSWRLIEDIAQNDDSGTSERWLAGCYASDELDYYEVDESVVKYYRDMKRGQRIIVDYAGADVPAPLVQPGGIAFTRDIMTGQTVSSTLRDDPRAAFIEQVSYDRNGIKLRGLPVGDEESAATTVLALASALRERQNRVRGLTTGGGQ